MEEGMMEILVYNGSEELILAERNDVISNRSIKIKPIFGK
jgi:hypothetical protein